jgi:hypothetical protein
MVDRGLDIPIPRVPAAGAPVKHGHQFRLRAGQLAAQQVGEKMVVAVPAPLFVQGDDEQVGSFEVH